MKLHRIDGLLYNYERKVGVSEIRLSYDRFSWVQAPNLG